MFTAEWFECGFFNTTSTKEQYLRIKIIGRITEKLKYKIYMIQKSVDLQLKVSLELRILFVRSYMCMNVC